MFDKQSNESAVERQDHPIQKINGKQENIYAELVKELNESGLVQVNSKNKETTPIEENISIANNSQKSKNMDDNEHYEILINDSTVIESIKTHQVIDNDITIETVDKKGENINKETNPIFVTINNATIDGNQDIQHENEGQKEKNDKKNDNYEEAKMLRQKQRQKYVDFLSDNEDFVWSSSSWEGSDSSDKETTEEEEKKEKTAN